MINSISTYISIIPGATLINGLLRVVILLYAKGKECFKSVRKK